MTHAEKTAALALLRDPQLVERIVADFATAIRNVGTHATQTEFAETLGSSGWMSQVSKDGAVRISERDGAKYVLRDKADSYSGWSADFTPAGSSDVTLKIRLGFKP